MKLYHGTTEAVARIAARDGLRTRRQTARSSNWKEHPSRRDCIYLTSVYAPYFAHAAAGDETSWGIIEVETDALSEAKMLPDEDFLEQACATLLPSAYKRGTLGAITARAMQELATTKQRTAWFRDALPMYRALWKNSVDTLGNCCYNDAIDESAITRIVVYNSKATPHFSLAAVDPVISTMNYLFCKRKYAALTQFILGRGLDDSFFDDIGFQQQYRSRIEEEARKLSIEVIKGGDRQ